MVLKILLYLILPKKKCPTSNLAYSINHYPSNLILNAPDEIKVVCHFVNKYYICLFGQSIGYLSYPSHYPERYFQLEH